MNYDNPLEFLLAVLIALGIVWLIESLITKTIKTILLLFVVLSIIGTYKYLNNDSEDYKKHQAKLKYENLPKFESSDLSDYTSFKRKFKLYEDNTIEDLKFDYQQIKKKK